MTGSNELIDDIITARSKAATFHKVDLHIHSYESPDFPKLGDKPCCSSKLTEDDHDAQAHHFVQSAKQIEDLRLIAITDHNLSRAAADISKLSDEQLVALPGMEVTLQATIFPDSRIHVLVIFPEGFASEDIQKVFPPSCGMPNYRDRTEESVAMVPIDVFIRQVHEIGGICIAGHVNSNQGVRMLFRDSNVQLLRAIMRRKELQYRKEHGMLSTHEEKQLGQLHSQIKALEDDIQNRYLEFLSNYRFDAVEVQRSSDYRFYAGAHTDELGIRPIACLLGSDAHNLQDIGLKDSTTYVKMTVPGLRDLRRALLDPGARVRYENTIQQPRISRILGLRFHGGFFQECALGFSDNLTCLIGGRGTGKSAAIEALRCVFEHKLDHLPKEKREDIDKRRLHTLAGATMELLFVDRNGDHFVLTAEYGNPGTKCLTIEGIERTELHVSTASNLAVKVYGWGEIEELARSKREQLRLIDGFIPEVDERIHEVNAASQELESNTGRIIALAKVVEQLLPRVAELPAKEADLQRLSTEELDAIFADFDRNEAANSAIEVLESTVGQIKATFVDANKEPLTLLADLEQSLETALPALEAYAWKDDFRASVLGAAQELQSRYQALIDQFDALKQVINVGFDSLKEERTSIESDLKEQAEEAEHEGFQALMSRRKQLAQQVSDLRALQKQIDDRQTSIRELMDRRRQYLVPDLQAKRRRLTKTRRAKVKEINLRLAQLATAAKVTIDLQHQKEREPFRQALGAPDQGAADGILKGVFKWYKKYDYAGLYSKRHSPHTFVATILNPDDYSALLACAVDDEGVIREVITRERAEQVARHLSPYIEPGKPYYDTQKLEQLLELEHLDTRDLPIVCLDSKPIEDLSPGQRCSTLIPIILLESNCPLIIDQPEDNLDNKLVFSLVVDILRSLKEQRQIIVATHNPNIPVSGDAEQIIVFEAPSRTSCEIIHQGSIDDVAVIDQIKAIMEGSEDAFRIRAEKYGYRLNYVG